MIRIIFWTIIIIVFLSFFGISIQSLFHSPLAQANFQYVWHLILIGWYMIVNFFQATFGPLLALIHR